MNINWLDPVSDHPLNRGLIVWYLTLPHQPGWKSDKWINLTDPLYGEHGTLTNMESADWLEGRMNGFGSLDFDGADDYVAIGDITSHFGDEEATFAVWLRMPVHTPTSTSNAGSWFFNSSNFDSLYTWTDGKIYDASFKSTRETVGAGIVTDRTKWHQVCVTRKAGTNGWNFYQNGQVIHTADGGTWGISTSMKVGEEEGLNHAFLGQMDNVRIYNRALLDSEVAELYQRSLDYNNGLLRQIAVPKPPPVTAGLQPWQQVMAIT